MSLTNIFSVIVPLTLFFLTISSVQVGQIQYAMLTNNTSVNISTNRSAAQCLCQALLASDTIVAINYFFISGVCEFFSNYELSFQVHDNPLSMLFLIQPLPPRPCCANLSWVLDMLGNAVENYEVAINTPLNLVIDNHNRLVTVEWNGRLIQMDRYNLSILNRITLNSTVVAALSYTNGLYYVGVGVDGFLNNQNALLVYNSTDMTLLTTITGDASYFGPIRECRFLRNSTQMLVLSQASYSYSRILLYQINSPTNYTLLNSSIYTPDFAADSLFQVNDTFYYFTLYNLNEPIYTLTSSLNEQSWTVGTFVTDGPQLTLITSVAVDSCGRVWAADLYSHIYIYDPDSGALLGIFAEIQKPFYILLLNDYELFVSTETNQTLRFAPHIYCTA